jgi:hypothetical protein
VSFSGICPSYRAKVSLNNCLSMVLGLKDFILQPTYSKAKPLTKCYIKLWIDGL